MTHSLIRALAVGGLVFSSSSFAQGPAGPGQGAATPGAPVPGGQLPGVQRPSLPPRDAPQRAQTGTARIRGRIVAAGGTAALRRAQITLTAADNVQFRRSTTSDSEGRYEFTELPAGQYQIAATKGGYVQLEYGQRRPFESGSPVSVRDGETLSQVDFALPKGSVISVRITDEFNEPIAGASIHVQRFQWDPTGQRRLVTAQTGNGGIGLASTDDRGEMRIFGLMPGEYVIEAASRLGSQPVQSGGGDRGEGFARTFYPGTISSSLAQPVSVGIGEEVSIQFSMAAAKLSTIRGTVADSQGRPASGARIQLITVSGGGTSSSGGVQAGADGAFVVSGVPPGEHTLRFNLRLGLETESASVPVTVNGDINGVAAVLGPGATISGRVVYEGTAPRSGPGWPPLLRVAAQDQVRQAIVPLSGSSGGDVDPDGNFRITGAEGHVFFTMPALPPTWVIKSVTHDGQDIADTPLDVTNRRTVSDVRITLTDRLTTVGGLVTDSKGQNRSDYVVVIQPAEQREPAAVARLVRALRPDTNGRFEVRGLRPGRYLATAVEAMEQNRHYSPEFQKELRRGAREFTVREGETTTLDLRLTAGI